MPVGLASDTFFADARKNFINHVNVILKMKLAEPKWSAFFFVHTHAHQHPC